MVEFEESECIDEMSREKSVEMSLDQIFINAFLDSVSFGCYGKKSVTVGMINTVYYLFIALAPCCLGIYFNWRTAKELRKACVFVNTEERQGKYSRIGKLSSLFTYMLVFYFLINFIHQFNILYHMTDLMNFDEWDWERYMNQYIQATHSCFSTKSLIQSFTFAAYSVQSFFIPSILFWFMNKR